jgi:hypothetical protein
MITGQTEASSLNVSAGGTIDGPAQIEVTRDLFLTAGGIARGTGEILSRGTLEIEDFSLDRRTLTNAGDGRLLADLTMENQSVINNRGRLDIPAGPSRRILGTPDEAINNNRGTFECNIGASSTMSVDVAFQNQAGTVACNSGTLHFFGPYGQSSLGRLIVRPGAVIIFEEPPFIANLSRIEGRSRIRSPNGPIRSSGTAAPGESPGTLTLEGDYVQEPEGTLEIELGGRVPDSEHDVLVVTGIATLGGTLELHLIDGFVPQIGDNFEILSASNVTRTFSGIRAVGFPRHLRPQVVYTPGSVRIKIVPTIQAIQAAFIDP